MRKAEESTPFASPRPRVGRCPYTEKACVARATELLGVIALTGASSVAVCLGRHQVMWSTARTSGPVSAWMCSGMRVGATRAEWFPGFHNALASAATLRQPPPEFLTVLPGRGSPLLAHARVCIVDGEPQTSPHLALVTLREFADAEAGIPPFEVAALRALVADMEIESAVTTSDMRITWASATLEARAGEGSLNGRMLHEVTSARERDALIGLARQVAVRTPGQSVLVRALPTGRRVGVADHTRDLGFAGLLWWWLAASDAPADLDRMTAVESAVNRFVDDLAWAGVETTRLSAKAVDSMSAAELLTAREREILELLSSGLRAPTIAAKLFLSPSTVRNHLSTAFRKVGVTSQAEFFELVAMKDDSERAPRRKAQPPE